MSKKILGIKFNVIYGLVLVICWVFKAQTMVFPYCKKTYLIYKDDKNGIKCWYVSSDQKILKKEALPQNINLNSINIKSALGEYNAFQLVCNSRQFIDNFTLELETPKKIENRIKFSWFKVRYKKVIEHNGTVREYPDILVKEKTNIIPGVNNCFWITLSTNNSLKNGDYVLALIGRDNHLKIFKIPIMLHIYNFSLPKITNIVILAHFRCFIKDTKLLFLYYKNLRDHGINGIIGYPFPKDNKSLTDYHKKILDYLFYNLDFQFTRIPNVFIGKRGIEKNYWKGVVIFDDKILTEEFRKKYFEYINNVLSLFQTNWKNVKLWYRAIDEPRSKHFIKVKKIYEYVKKEFPELTTEMSREPIEMFYGVIEVWNVHPVHFNEKIVKKRQLLGEKVTLYSKVTLYYNDMFSINKPAVYPRLVPWLIWKYKLDGCYFYSVIDKKENYFFAPATKSNKFLKGILIYSDPITGFPINSLRWEQFRKGIEDLKYLLLLEKLWQEGKLKPFEAEIEQIMTHINNNLSMYNFDINPEGIKNKIGGIIEKYFKDGG